MTKLKEHSREICYKKIAFALKSNSHWWFMRQNITMVNTDEVVSETISQEQRGLETGCRRAPRRFFLCKLFDKIHFWKNTHFNIQLLPFLRQNLSSYCVCYVFHEAKAESTSTLPFTRFPWVSWHEKFLSVWFSFVIPILRLVITWSCKTFKHQSCQMMGLLWY